MLCSSHATRYGPVAAGDRCSARAASLLRTLARGIEHLRSGLGWGPVCGPSPGLCWRDSRTTDAPAGQSAPWPSGGCYYARHGMSSTPSDESAAVRIDRDNEWAWCGARRLELTPRVFAVLSYLVEHPHRLVTKDDLLATVWRDAVVSDAALASCIRDLRRALGDSSDTPRYIETVHRRGFRFIGPVTRPATAVAEVRTAAREVDAASTPLPPAAPMLVGREPQLARLRA